MRDYETVLAERLAERLAGRVKPKSQTRGIMVNLPTELWDRLHTKAKRSGMYKTDIVIAALEVALAAMEE